MPQIDTVAYFSIISWSAILITSGFLLFNLYIFLPIVARGKIFLQWRNYQVGVYWLNCKTLKILGKGSHLQQVNKILSSYDFNKLRDAHLEAQKSSKI